MVHMYAHDTWIHMYGADRYCATYHVPHNIPCASQHTMCLTTYHVPHNIPCASQHTMCLTGTAQHTMCLTTSRYPNTSTLCPCLSARLSSQTLNSACHMNARAKDSKWCSRYNEVERCAAVLRVLLGVLLCCLPFTGSFEMGGKTKVPWCVSRGLTCGCFGRCGTCLILTRAIGRCLMC